MPARWSTAGISRVMVSWVRVDAGIGRPAGSEHTASVTRSAAISIWIPPDRMMTRRRRLSRYAPAAAAGSPARAGIDPSGRSVRVPLPGFPRTCGDRPRLYPDEAEELMVPPHVRG